MCKGGSCGDDKPGYVNHTPKWFKVLFAYLIGFSVILSVLIMLILLVGTYIAITRYL